jgi:hypothetical protein
MTSRKAGGLDNLKPPLRVRDGTRWATRSSLKPLITGQSRQFYRISGKGWRRCSKITGQSRANPLQKRDIWPRLKSLRWRKNETHRDGKGLSSSVIARARTRGLAGNHFAVGQVAMPAFAVTVGIDED